MLHIIPEIGRTGLAFIVVLGVLVFVHEAGHYLAARWCGVHVEAFSIGFGRALAGWTDRRGTRWKIGWIPLGGYVKMHGQERPEDVSDEDRARWLPGQTFHGKTVGQRALVVAAGPIANFLLACVLFAALFATVGRPVATSVVGEVVVGSAAEHAGLKAGDRIAAIDGKSVRRFEDIQHIVMARPGQPITLTVDRGKADAGQTLTLQAQVDSRDDGSGGRIGVLGIRGGGTEYEKVDPAQAIGGGIRQTWEVSVATLDGVWQMITGKRGTEDLGGPLRIAQLSGQVAQLGIASLVSFMAVLSVNLGLINLFPIPVLDGGHLVFFLAEAVRGRPIPQRAQEYSFRAGLALLGALFVFSTWNDLTHLGIFRWVAGLIG